MSIKDVKKSLIGGLSVYKDLLGEISEDEFQMPTDHGGWSLSQLYSHILSVNKLSLISIEKCINGTAKRDSRRTDWRVWLIMLFGKLPPGRIKAPDRIAAMVTQITREEARNQLIKFFERFELICTQIPKAVADQKISHPRLGPLNARQWLRFMDIHTRHHIAQLRRIHAGISTKKQSDS